MSAPTYLVGMGIYLYDWEQENGVDCILNLAGFRCGFQEIVRDCWYGPENHSPSSLHSKASWFEIPMRINRGIRNTH